MEKYTVLIVDDEDSQRIILKGNLVKKGYRVLDASSANDALMAAENNVVDVIVSDFKMPDMTGLELLREIKKRNPETGFVMVTAYATIKDAVNAMKDGAFDYLVKPFDLDELDIIIRRLIERKHLISEVKHLKEQISSASRLGDLIASSSSMQGVLDVASRAASSKASVLIQGESGTGKEVLARAIHFASSRLDNPFVAINCAALNENLLESELFGHEKGAFTGAERKHTGRFELADGGTLFLDEIGDIPLATQVKLLRVLQEGEFERVGGMQTLKVDVRVVAATNKDIEQLIKDEKFREDLFYRINVVNIKLPPLRDRREDIPMLIEYFLNKYLPETGKSKAEFSREAYDVMMKYRYPGNIRELENIVHHALVMSRGEIISTSDLPMNLRELPAEEDLIQIPDSDYSMTDVLENIEKRLVKKALDKSNGNQTKAAKMLGIPERNLRYRIEKWGWKEKEQ